MPNPLPSISGLTVLRPGRRSAVDSIAVSVFVVILVAFDEYKYWDEQACLVSWTTET